MAENKTFAGLLKLHVPNELNVMAAVIGEKAVNAKTAQGSPDNQNLGRFKKYKCHSEQLQQQRIKTDIKLFLNVILLRTFKLQIARTSHLRNKIYKSERHV
ncbi:hypothetical protein RUM43_007869 [Polyplax serrata]|uniref:Uncharacterized protein n=1 Tax=Polyplax serrata TaxID=468196 RepID=A0AAN8PDY0_POLSC